jgi:PEP-CTERM motif
MLRQLTILRSSQRGFLTTVIARTALIAAALVATSAACSAGMIALGQASNFAVLYEGGGVHQLGFNNSSIAGNLGIGGSGKFAGSNPGTITGDLEFSAADTGQFSNSGVTFVPSVNNPTYNVALVTSALNTVNTLSSTLGAESGTHISVNGNATINAIDGTLDGNGNRVFTVDAFSLNSEQTLTINADRANDSVVFNFNFNLQYHGNTALNGLAADQVLFNVVGGANLSGGHTLDINTNGGNDPEDIARGIFLDPNGAMSISDSNLVGRIFGGDSHDDQIVSGAHIDGVNTQLVVPEPSSFVLSVLGLIGLVAARSRRRRKASPTS